MPEVQLETLENVAPAAQRPGQSSDFDFDLMPIKACLINDPDCESCQ